MGAEPPPVCQSTAERVSAAGRPAGSLGGHQRSRSPESTFFEKFSKKFMNIKVRRVYCFRNIDLFRRR